MKYFLLRDDINIVDKWILGAIENCDNWRFSDPTAEFMEPCTYSGVVKHMGHQLDFNLAGYASVPIVSEKFKNALSGLKEVDEPYFHVVFEPIVLNNLETKEKFYVMIVETQLDCVDEKKSKFKKYGIDDPVRPDRVGEYSAFFDLVVDEKSAEGKHIFRIKKYLGALIVSEEVRARLLSADIKGAVFDSVNGDSETVA